MATCAGRLLQPQHSRRRQSRQIRLAESVSVWNVKSDIARLRPDAWGRACWISVLPTPEIRGLHPEEKNMSDTKNASGAQVPCISLLDNEELSHAIVQTFNLLGRCSPHSDEMKRTQAHYDRLLTEREARLSNDQNEGRQEPPERKP
jgi:hypothetical protein